MSTQQESGSSVLSTVLSLTGKKFFLYGVPILVVLFLIPMCAGMVVIDSSYPPYTEEDIIVFHNIGLESEIFFVDLMVYHFVVLQGYVTEGLVRQIAYKFKYAVPRQVPIIDEDGNPTFETVAEERTYSLQQALTNAGISSSEIEMALDLGAIWGVKFGQIGFVADFPKEYVVPNSPFIWPTPTLTFITSSYGIRWGKQHHGIDIAGNGAFGSPIVTIADGYVSQINYDLKDACGLSIRVNHEDGYESRYCHLSALHVAEEVYVSKGQVIAAVGNTGVSTGPHLHLEMKQYGELFDPLPHIFGSKP